LLVVVAFDLSLVVHFGFVVFHVVRHGTRVPSLSWVANMSVVAEIAARLNKLEEDDECAVPRMPAPTPEELERAARIEVERQWEAAVIRERLESDS
jgi:hypothetical protein